MNYDRFPKGTEVYHRVLGHAVVQDARRPAFSVVKFDSGQVENVANIMLTAQPVTRSTVAVVPAITNDYSRVKAAMWKIREKRAGPRGKPTESSVAKVQALQNEVAELEAIIGAANRDIVALRNVRVLYPGGSVGQGYVQPLEYVAAQGRKVMAMAELRAKTFQLNALQKAQEVRFGKQV